MIAIDMTIDLFDDRINKLMRVRLLESLMQMHDIAHHLNKETYNLAAIDEHCERDCSGVW